MTSNAPKPATMPAFHPHFAEDSRDITNGQRAHRASAHWTVYVNTEELEHWTREEFPAHVSELCGNLFHWIHSAGLNPHTITAEALAAFRLQSGQQWPEAPAPVTENQGDADCQ